ncbi:MAG TPA: UbiA prenyltransferase family protein [Ktedonobacteraceae bacterium]|jgi:4-hydroxybenzoate polyprenyltransferase|nr:UbiA prenyltransferase family protein [Ktedonobacteraceae bacterium]
MPSSPKAISSATPQLGVTGRLSALFVAMRPQQWTKNLAIFVGIVFAQRLLNLISFERGVVAFVTFCLASSSIYLFNDLLDLANDRQHPKKKYRPLAAGTLPEAWAKGAIVFLWLACAGLATGLFFMPIHEVDIFAAWGGTNFLFACTLAFYVALMILYSLRLKHVVLLDVFIIASGFALRILAGAVAIPVSISPWLYMVTIMLSLLLALGKRRNELVLMEQDASNHRQILKEYTLPLLDQMITIVTTATVIAYSLYTFQANTGDHRLMITVPLVLYGTFRYLYLIYVRKEGGSPEEVLVRDRHMLATVVVCVAIVIVVLYALPR